MNETQRLLALEAALTACEGIPFLGFATMQKLIGKRLEKIYPDFDDFLSAQRKAIQLLADSPEVFGG